MPHSKEVSRPALQSLSSAKMNALREFLESSTIHGLSYISTSKSRAGKVFWCMIVLGGFCSAGFLINNSYVDWRQSPVSTSTSTVPINQLPFPKVTVCPPKDSNTALNPDLVRFRNKGMTKANRESLMRIAKTLFLQGPHMLFVNRTKDLLNQNNIRKCYAGSLSFEFPWNGHFSLENIATEGAELLGKIGAPAEAHDWQYDMQYKFSLKVPSNTSLVVTLVVDPEFGVVLSGMGEPSMTDDKLKHDRDISKLFELIEVNEFTYHGKALSFDGAVASCNNEGKYLASMTSLSEIDRFNSYTSNWFWLGARYQADSSSWQWEDGSPWNWTNWKARQPSSSSYCASADGKREWGVTNACDKAKYAKDYFCERMKGKHYSIKGTQNITLFFDKKNTSDLLSITWKYRESSRLTMPGVFLKWNMSEPALQAKEPARDIILAALVNLVIMAKPHRSISEMWLVLATEKLTFSKTKYKSFCIKNALNQRSAKLVIEKVSSKLGVNVTYESFADEFVSDEDLETGFEMMAFLMYCPWNKDPNKCATGSKGCETGETYGMDATEAEILTLYTQLLASSDGTLIQSAAKLTEYSKEKEYFGAVKNFFSAVVGTLKLTVGKVVVAKTARSKLSYSSSLPFLKNIADMCIIDDNQACYDHLKEVYQPDMEELSSHPVHLLSKDYNLMPSALIPYCAFGIEMKNLGSKINNFSQPICTAFGPVLLDGELCYELDRKGWRLGEQGPL